MTSTIEQPQAPARPAKGMSFRLVNLGRLNFFYSTRTIVVSAIIVVLIAILFVAELGLGDYGISPADVLKTLQGQGSRIQDFIIYDIRLPRALSAILVGAALGMAGCVFQSLTRNALGSPDIIGFTEGASLGAVIALLTFHADQPIVVVGAIIGGLAVAAVVYVLSYKRGVQSYRLILVGIGVSFLLESIVEYMLLRANVLQAQRALVWLTGSLNNRTWQQVFMVAIALCILVPATLAFGRRLALLEMGDDLAAALGVGVEPSRRWLLVLGTAATAVAVAAAGPIAFIALAAPQVARRMVGGKSVALLSSALMGAFLLIASDLAAQWALYPMQVPVGVATLVVGGVYLAGLLFFENRAGRD